jgi:hypothetical protein
MRIAPCLLLATAVCAQKVAATGAIVSAQFYCTANPCEEHWQFGLSRTDMAINTAENDAFLQVYLPPANTAQRQFEVFTAYDDASRTFVTIAADYPQTRSLTAWVSTVSEAVDSAVPVVVGAVLAYPPTSSPYPLNVVPLKVSRIFFGAGGALYATFTNGEVHRIDTSTGAFALAASIIPDALQLGTTHPYATWGQVYDGVSNSLYSVIFAASDAFLATTDLSTGLTAPYLQLRMPGVKEELFAPETFINAHMTDLPDGSRRLLLCTESLNNDGFDQMNFVNMTSGQLEGPVYNLNADDLIILSCEPSDAALYKCDKWRVSTWDPATSTLWFQGHYQDPQEGPTMKLFGAAFSFSHISGNLGYIISAAAADVPYGYTGYQFVTYPPAAAAPAFLASPQ